MSGFDLPPVRGFDKGFQRPEQPFVSPELQDIGPLQGGVERPSGVADSGAADSGAGTATPFSGVLADSLNEVRGLQLDVKDKVRGMVMGEDVELHDVMIASSKSEVAFNLLLEVRNKMVDAWEKLSRSSV